MFLNIDGKLILYILLIMALFFIVYLIVVLIVAIVIYRLFLDVRLGDRLIKPVEYTFYEGLKKEDFSFYSGKNKLNGGIYYKNKDLSNILILVHGYGANHKDYYNHMDYLTDMGYTIYAYDGTGTSISEGKNFGGAPQAIIDLLNCINEVKRLNPNSKITLYGHSMGAYAVCNVLNFTNVDKVVALAPFDNMADIVMNKFVNKFGKKLFLLKPMYKLIQRIKFGKYAKYTTYKTLKNTNTKVLVVHGENDITVPTDKFLENKDTLNNPNVYFLFVKDKNHRPLQSLNAVNYHEYLKLKVDGMNIKYKKKIPDEVINEFNNSIDRKIQNELDQNILLEVKKFLKEI